MKMKKYRSWRKLTDNEEGMRKLAWCCSVCKGQKYADLGRSSVTRVLPYFDVGNDGEEIGNQIIFARVAVALVSSFLRKWGTL